MKSLHTLLDKLIISKRKEIPFIIFFSFVVSFILTRIWIYLMFEGRIPNMFLYIKGIHVHHLNFGIFILSVVGFITLAYQDFTKKYIHVLSFIYGIGLALTFDEFALWLHLEDVYWHRISYDAVVVIAGVMMNIVYFEAFWKWFMKKLRLHKTKHAVKLITHPVKYVRKRLRKNKPAKNAPTP